MIAIKFGILVAIGVSSIMSAPQEVRVATPRGWSLPSAVHEIHLSPGDPAEARTEARNRYSQLPFSLGFVNLLYSTRPEAFFEPIVFARTYRIWRADRMRSLGPGAVTELLALGDNVGIRQRGYAEDLPLTVLRGHSPFELNEGAITATLIHVGPSGRMPPYQARIEFYVRQHSVVTRDTARAIFLRLKKSLPSASIVVMVRRDCWFGWSPNFPVRPPFANCDGDPPEKLSELGVECIEGEFSSVRCEVR